MSDDLFDQLAGSEGALDPGSAFRERLWQRVEAELDRPVGDSSTAAVAVEQPDAVRGSQSRPAGALAWLRASRTRTVPVAAAAVAVLSLGLGVAMRSGDDPDAEQTVDVVDDPSPDSAGPATLPSLGPPAVASQAPVATATAAAPRPAAAAGRAVSGAPVALPDPRPSSPARAWSVWYASIQGDSIGVFTAVAGEAGSQRRVVGGDGFDVHPALSRDRRQLAWTRGQADHEARSIWVADADGSRPRQLPLTQCPVQLQCDYTWPTFGGAGRLAFTRGTANSSCTPAERCDEVVVYDLQSGGLTAVAYGQSPDWSSRRDEIVYAGAAGPEPRSACESGLCGDDEIRIVDLAAPGRPSRSVGGAVGHSPRFSPDGEWIAFERVIGATGGGVGVVVRRDGTGLRDLPGCRQPNWAPDGRIACWMTVDGGNDVFLLDADDEPGVRLTFTPDVDELQFRIYPS